MTCTDLMPAMKAKLIHIGSKQCRSWPIPRLGVTRDLILEDGALLYMM